MELTGIHHLTAVSAQIRQNHRFYTRTLGMRLVKRSVNQDDTSAYHLFYADGAGHARHRPDLFRLAGAAASGAARSSITRTGAARRRAARRCEWWAGHLREHGRDQPARSPSATAG